MNFWQRVKNLWKLSEYEVTQNLLVKKITGGISHMELTKPRPQRLATIIGPDMDPLKDFPNEEVI